MKLFPNDSNATKNLLPYNGTVHYHGPIVDAIKATSFYNEFFKNIEWKNDEAYLFGKHHITKRKVAWYGNQAYEYRYSNTTKIALPWTPALLDIKSIVELVSKESYNSCLMNLYHNGSESMAWHSDGEKDLKENGCIASVSFGAERKFAFKHKKTKESIAIQLEQGSLLTMKDETQKYWLHRLPPTKKIHQPRINLTFRTIEPEEK